MKIRRCDRCGKDIKPGEWGWFRQKVVMAYTVFMAFGVPLPDAENELCADCTMLYRDFMEGEAIPAVKDKEKGGNKQDAGA